LQLGSVILNRLVLGPPLAAALVPTLAIEVAPPAVAGNAYFALREGPDDPFMYALAGFCALSVVAQLRFVPLFRRLPFAATFWAFTFSYTSVATFGLNWVARERPAGAEPIAWVVAGAATVFVAAIAVASARAVVAGRFFPGVPVTSEAPA
jgi:tellurite resistance protein